MLQLWDHNNGTMVFQQDSAQLDLYTAVHTYHYTVLPSKWTQYAWPMPWPLHSWDLITFYFCLGIHEGCGVLHIPPVPTASMSCSSASQSHSPRCTRKCCAKYGTTILQMRHLLHLHVSLRYLLMSCRWFHVTAVCCIFTILLPSRPWPNKSHWFSLT